MNTSRRRFASGVVLLALIGLSYATVRANERPGMIAPSRDRRAQLDSIQQWAHHFADSVIAEIGNGSDLGEGMNYLKNQLSQEKPLRLDAEADSVFSELRGRLSIPPGHLHLTPIRPQQMPNGGTMLGDDAHHYFLKVIPGNGKPKASAQQVGKNLWLIEEDTEGQPQ